MFRWSHLIVVLLLTLSALAPAAACHAAPPQPVMAHCDQPLPPPPPGHPDAALAAPCLGCAVPAAAIIAAPALALAGTAAPNLALQAHPLTGSSPTPADRPPRLPA